MFHLEERFNGRKKRGGKGTVKVIDRVASHEALQSPELVETCNPARHSFFSRSQLWLCLHLPVRPYTQGGSNENRRKLENLRNT